MRISMSKAIVAGLTALALTAAISISATSPAAAFRMGGGGFGGGFHGGGGFGGGWHGGGGFGGWRGGGFGGGWRGGYGGYRGYGYGRYGYRGYGYGYGGWGYPGWGYAGWGFPWWGLGYGPGWGSGAYYAGDGYYGGDNGCWAYRRVWTRPGGRGRYLGQRLVNVC
jgi:hypothetical protein